MSDTGRRFSRDYAEARSRFREATSAHEAGTIEIGDDLSIDWAWVGPSDAPRVILYTSGLHGIEGFGGGAAQLETLALGSDVATMYVHGLNPHGWRHLRRVNENNVDLNRNFLLDGQEYAGASPAYARLDSLLNPATPPGGLDLFWIHAAWAVSTQGYGAMKNAIVSGQYEFERGLFFGGKRMEAGPRAVTQLLLARLSGRERVVHVDWHSALGKYGDRTLLLEGAVDETAAARVRRVMGEGVRTWDATDKSAYTIRGGMTAFLQAKLPGVRYDGLTCEFGTQPNLQVLAALRAENRLHHWGTPTPEHPAKAAMRAAFAPREARWEEAVLAHARDVHALCHTLIEA